jgi:hypothetical protein
MVAAPLVGTGGLALQHCIVQLVIQARQQAVSRCFEALSVSRCFESLCACTATHDHPCCWPLHVFAPCMCVPAEKRKLNAYESIDYFAPNSSVYRKWLARQVSWGGTACTPQLSMDKHDTNMTNTECFQQDRLDEHGASMQSIAQTAQQPSSSTVCCIMPLIFRHHSATAERCCRAVYQCQHHRTVCVRILFPLVPLLAALLTVFCLFP